MYLHLKQDLCQSMMGELDRSITDAKAMTRFIWNRYIQLGPEPSHRHRTIRQLAVSDKITKETEQRADDIFPELRDLCHRSVLPVFMSDEYRAFGDGLFLALAERPWISPRAIPRVCEEYIALGIRSHVARTDSRGTIMDGQTLHPQRKTLCSGTAFYRTLLAFRPQYECV
ncbi:tetR family transcriptional regulator [Salmonella bongori]|nr:tetR family transcriptional regulator [Salmonella bongori]